MVNTVALLVLAVCACVSALPIDDQDVFVGDPKFLGGDVRRQKIVFESVPNEGYYFYNAVTGNWSEAFAYCQSEGAHMAVVDSTADATGILELMASHSANNIHMGFHDQYVEGVYMNVNDEEIDTTNSPWANGAPTGGEELNCGGFSAAGITDIDCATKRTSFCELSKWDKYDVISGHGMYNYHPERRTWSQAWEMCHGEGGHLVVINTPEELEAIKVTYPTWMDMWVGVHRLHGNDVFTTVLSKPLNSTGYSQWLPLYPYGDSVSRPYVALKHSEDGVGLWTFTPTGQLPFVCEHALA